MSQRVLTECAVTVDEVTVRYGRAAALSGVSLDLRAGDVAAVVGLNGAGKSTLLRVLAAAMAPTSGVVTTSWGATSAQPRLFRSAVGYVPAEPELKSRLSIAESMHYSAWLKRVPAQRSAAQCSVALEHVGLTAHAQRRVGSLSTGLRRRLSVAQAMVADPDVLVLDEFSSGVDEEHRGQLYDAIRATPIVVFSSHSRDEVCRLATCLVVLDKGRARVQQLEHLPETERRAVVTSVFDQL